MATFFYAIGKYIRTPEIRLKNREASLGKKLSENTKIKISLGGKGKKELPLLNREYQKQKSVIGLK